MLNVQPRLESSKLMMWLSPFIAVTLTLAVSSVLFVWLDVSPLKAFQVFVMMPFSDSYNLGELLVKSAPLMLCAVGLALCYRANIWNIGAEGQLLIGAVAASAIAVNADDTSGIGMLLATLIAGMGCRRWLGRDSDVAEPSFSHQHHSHHHHAQLHRFVCAAVGGAWPASRSARVRLS